MKLMTLMIPESRGSEENNFYSYVSLFQILSSMFLPNIILLNWFTVGKVITKIKVKLF